MTRTTTSAFNTELAKKGLQPIELLDLFFGSQTADDASTLHFAIHDQAFSFFNIDGVATTYTPIGVRRSEITNVMDNEQRQATLEIDNINRQFQTFFFQNADFMRDKRVILRTILVGATGAAADAVRLIDGMIDVVTITERLCQIELHGVIGGLMFRTGWIMDRICPYRFAGAFCAQSVSAATLLQSQADTAASGSTKSSIKATSLNRLDDYYNIGTIKFTAGQNKGLMRKVIDWTLSTKIILPDVAFPYDPAVGDAFTIARDCDKTFSQCKNRYTEIDAVNGNAANFGGFDTLVRTINP